MPKIFEVHLTFAQKLPELNLILYVVRLGIVTLAGFKQAKFDLGTRWHLKCLNLNPEVFSLKLIFKVMPKWVDEKLANRYFSRSTSKLSVKEQIENDENTKCLWNRW